MSCEKREQGIRMSCEKTMRWENERTKDICFPEVQSLPTYVHTHVREWSWLAA